MKSNIQNKGITLIALVITIIVLLILAGVTISTLTGDNGILTQAQNAKNKNAKATAKERIQVEAMGSYNLIGKLDLETVKSNINENIPEAAITGTEFPITVKLDGYSFEVYENGEVKEVASQDPDDTVDRSELKVGDYVNYTPDIVTDTYQSTSSENGTTTFTLTQDTTLKWKILKKHDDGKIDLISEEATNYEWVGFGNSRGYNNVLYIIDEIIGKFYSNSKLNATARSIKLDDIEAHISEDGIEARNTYSNIITYNTTKKYTGDYSYYPTLYAYENKSGINSEVTKTDGIGQSDITPLNEFSTQSSSATNGLTVTQTYYNIDLENYCDSNIASVLKTANNYFIGTRCVDCSSDYATYGIFYSNGSNLEFYCIDDSAANIGEASDPFLEPGFRPIVTLGENIEITLCEGENSSTNMHTITLLEE